MKGNEKWSYFNLSASSLCCAVSLCVSLFVSVLLTATQHKAALEVYSLCM